MITTRQHITIKPKRITMDDLGEMIKKGFDGAQSDLNYAVDRIDQKIDNLDKKMEFRFDGLQNQIDNISINYTPRVEHDSLKGRVKKIERKVGIRDSA